MLYVCQPSVVCVLCAVAQYFSLAAVYHIVCGACGRVCGRCRASTVYNRIKVNLFFSLVYNTCGILFAAGVFVPGLHVTLPPQFAGTPHSHVL